ncbi:Bro-N domain-containing protein [Chromobacterium subtsugae]|uniref:BRO-N domain-containing protein n=1 Tax=Chromobacterium subtsugae TaxID=251747 RepID=UPI001364C38C|nr:BRO family protein [Chromobacterium subtsugae]
MTGFGDSNYMEVRCTAALHNLDGVLAMTQLAHSPMQPGLLSFPFLNHTIHLLRRHNGLWFFADDVAAAIKCRTTAALLSKLSKEEVRAMPLGGGEVVCLSETGVATAIRRYRKPAARRFRRWLEDELLPALRREGEEALTADQLELALALAAEAARQVSRAVLDAVLENGEACWQHSRWLVTLDYERHNRQKHPLGRMMGLNSAVATLDALAEMIAVPDGMPATDTELVKLAAACHLRLAERMSLRVADE